MSDTDLNNQDSVVKQDGDGTITFANDVIATIAGLAAMDIDGVAGMSGGFVNGIAALLGKKNLTKGIKVEVGQVEVAVDIAVIVKYGYRIPEVAENIQNSVVKAIETMTGLKVKEVNINVLGIDVPDPQKQPNTSTDVKPKEF